MPAVTVNFDVNVDATGTIRVFTQSAETMQNVVVCGSTPAASFLYKGATAGQSLIQFQGTANATTGLPTEDITGIFNDSYITNLTNTAEVIGALNSVINGSMNAAAADPFTAYPDHQQYSNFGHLALASYAKYLFGHPAATAAIDNDTTFINKMKGSAEGDASLAAALFAAIEDQADPTLIAKQVIGQDASRAQAVDNDAATPNAYQNLLFQAGDVLYFNITLTTPTVTIAAADPVGSSAISSLPLTQSFPAGGIKYSLKVTLA